MQRRSTILVQCLSISLFTLLLINTANGQSFIWAKNQTGSNNTYGNYTATDKNGNVFVTGHFFSQAITFGSVTITNSNTSFADFYIVKYDPLGNVLWAKSAGGTNTESGTGITADAAGNVIVCGWFLSPSISFGSTTLTNTAQYLYDAFVVKFDPNGNVVWAKSGGGSGDDRALAAATDATGNIYVTGIFKGPSASFGTNVLTSMNSASEDIFLLKYDASGNVTKATGFGSYGADWGCCITTDASNNVYLTGGFTSPSLTFGSTTLTNAGGFDMLIVKFDFSGNPLWAKSAGGTNLDFALVTVADKSNNIYVSGYFSSAGISFGTNTLINGGTNTNDAFLVKYDNAGNVLWSNQAKGSGAEMGYSTAVDDFGNAFLVGSFSSPTTSFGSLSIPTKGSHDVFIAKYDAAGSLVSVRTSGGTADDVASSATMDANNNLLITGSFMSSTLNFGKDTLSNTGSYKMFVAKLSSNNTGLLGHSRTEYAVNIYPNPSRGIFTISLPTLIDNGSVAIYTLLGECIYTALLNSVSEKTINTGALSAGVYIVKIKDGEQEYTRKITME